MTIEAVQDKAISREEAITKLFNQHFDCPPAQVFHAPGRVKKLTFMYVSLLMVLSAFNHAGQHSRIDYVSSNSQQ